jgi:hypothetical protein
MTGGVAWATSWVTEVGLLAIAGNLPKLIAKRLKVLHWINQLTFVIKQT